MEMNELLKEAAGLEKQLRQLTQDVKNKEIQKVNLESDLRTIKTKKDKLTEDVKQLEDYVKLAVSESLVSERIRIVELEEEVKGELDNLKAGKSLLADEIVRAEELGDDAKRAIEKNIKTADDLARKLKEANEIKFKLEGIVDYVKGALK